RSRSRAVRRERPLPVRDNAARRKPIGESSSEPHSRTDDVAAPQHVMQTGIRLAGAAKVREARCDRRILVEQIRDVAENLPAEAAARLDFIRNVEVGIPHGSDRVVVDLDAFHLIGPPQATVDPTLLQEEAQWPTDVAQVGGDLVFGEVERTHLADPIELRYTDIGDRVLVEPAEEKPRAEHFAATEEVQLSRVADVEIGTRNPRL